jgi:hypothetical protein
MTPAERRRLVAAVQANCDIADARSAAEMTLCVYLLQMREYYRWAHDLPFEAVLARAEVGEWIAARERRWAQVEDRPFAALPLPGGGEADPFDLPAVEAALRPVGLVYGAGQLGPGRALFFLAEAFGRHEREGLPVLVAGRELARGLPAPPAALQDTDAGARIVVRRDALARWGFEKFEAFTLRRQPGSAFAEVARAYGFAAQGFSAALPRWLDEQQETMVLHEIGEHRAGQRLGPDWAAMRARLPTRRGELAARALRDQLADLGSTLPALLDRGASAALHFWFANYDGLRAQLYPGLHDAYRRWAGGDGGRALRAACARGTAHFEAAAAKALEHYRARGAEAGAAIEAFLTGPEVRCGEPPP